MQVSMHQTSHRLSPMERGITILDREMDDD